MPLYPFLNPFSNPYRNQISKITPIIGTEQSIQVNKQAIIHDTTPKQESEQSKPKLPTKMKRRTNKDYIQFKI